MRVQRWSCLLGLLCMPAGVILDEWTASQHPSSTCFVKLNSTIDISCSTSLSDPLGLSLMRRFPEAVNVVYLSLDNGEIAKITQAAQFQNRIRVSPGSKVKNGHNFTVQLSQLGVEDTNLFFCNWTHFENSKFKDLSSTGTVLLVGETDPEEKCESNSMELVLICLLVTVVVVIVVLSIVALVFKCMKFRDVFRPNGEVKPPTETRHRLVIPEQPVHHQPYLITSMSPPGHRTLP
ncbi:unnamed protein product [Ophioblennius macclurei]